MARREYGVGLLAAQHHGGYLRSVCQMRYTCFDDFYAGYFQAFGYGMFQSFLNHIARRAQGYIVMAFDIVIGIFSGDTAQCGIGLYLYKILVRFHPARGGIANTVNRRIYIYVVVYIEHHFVRVTHFPYHHKAYHYRISDFIVDFYRLGIKVPGFERYLFSAVERIEPVKAVFGKRALVFTEEHDYSGFVGFHHDKPAKQYNGGNDAYYTRCYAECHAYVVHKYERTYGSAHKQEKYEQHQKARQLHAFEFRFLCFHLFKNLSPFIVFFDIILISQT